MLGLLATSQVFAKKTDIIYMKNGDRVTGTIKELVGGKLGLKTYSLGTVFITWQDVAQIESTKPIQIELTDGRRALGRITKSGEDGVISIRSGAEDLSFPVTSIVVLEPVRVDQSFWERLDGSIKFGVSYTQSSDVGQLNIGADARLREETFQVSTSLNGNLTSQSGRDDTERIRFDVNYQRFRPNRWFWSGGVAVERNDQLGIDYRILGGGGVGRYLKQTIHQEFSLAGGLVANAENRVNRGGTVELEGAIGADWRIFMLASPKTSLLSSVIVYPSITDAGRIRTNVDIRLRQEFVKDLFWDISFYETSDTDPPEGASSSDYGFVTSIGYSF